MRWQKSTKSRHAIRFQFGGFDAPRLVRNLLIAGRQNRDTLRTMNSSLDLQVVILTYQRHTLLQKCIDSVLKARQCADQRIGVEIIINGEGDSSNEFLLPYQNQVDFRVQAKPRAPNPGEARNQIESDICAEWICFLDDDVEVPETFFKDFFELSKNSEHGVWGGANLTPLGSQYFQTLSGYWLASYWGAAKSAQRYFERSSVQAEIAELTLCNLFVRSDIFKQVLFPKGFVCAEEVMLLHEIQKQGIRFGTSEKLRVWHHRRDYRQFYQQIYKYAWGRGQCLYQGVGSFYHCIPSLFAIGLLMWFAGVRELDPLFVIYGILNSVFALQFSWQMQSVGALFVSLVGLPILHLSFGTGVVRGYLFQMFNANRK